VSAPATTVKTAPPVAPPTAPPKSHSIVYYVVGFIAMAIVVGGVCFLAFTRKSEARAEGQKREDTLAQGPHVRVATVGHSPPQRDVTVEAEAQPYASVTLYAKISGYLRAIKVDKGDKVTKGQVMAIIESPELDQQYLAAQADAVNKRVTEKRAKALVGPGVVSAQDYDTAVASADVADATQRAAADQRGYETLRAPFDGTVTARYADPGALMQSATGAQTGALPVVTVAQVDRLRIYAYLDQRDATFIHEGEVAEVRLAERPGALFKGTVTRLSHDLDPKTRTMLVEVDLDDKEGLIVPGSFVQVTLKIPVPSLVQVPVAALVLRGTAPFVAVVGDDNHVNYAPVKLSDDDGKTARVLEGLKGNERVALNLGDDVADGSLIQPVAEEGANVAPQH
jgi:membrane fusion protein, multidrug efflux system